MEIVGKPGTNKFVVLSGRVSNIQASTKEIQLQAEGQVG